MSSKLPSATVCLSLTGGTGSSMLSAVHRPKLYRYVAQIKRSLSLSLSLSVLKNASKRLGHPNCPHGYLNLEIHCSCL
jgi:hypothetical protein